MRRFVEKHFERFRALIARIQTGDGYAQGIDRGIGAGPIGIRANVDANFFARPASLVDVSEAFGQAHALFADKRGHAQDPAAIGAIVFGPEMRAIDGRRGFQDLGQLCGHASVAEFSLPAREFVAILEIAKLIFQLDELRGKEEVFAGVICGVVGDRVVPGLLFGGRESRFCLRRYFQRRPAGLAGIVRRRGGRPLPGFMIERVMKIDPKTAVEFKDRERPVSGTVLRPRSRLQRKQQQKR